MSKNDVHPHKFCESGHFKRFNIDPCTNILLAKPVVGYQGPGGTQEVTEVKGPLGVDEDTDVKQPMDTNPNQVSIHSF